MTVKNGMHSDWTATNTFTAMPAVLAFTLTAGDLRLLAAVLLDTILPSSEARQQEDNHRQ